MPVNLKSDEVTVTSFSTKDVAIVGAFKMAADMGKRPEDPSVATWLGRPGCCIGFSFSGCGND